MSFSRKMKRENDFRKVVAIAENGKGNLKAIDIGSGFASDESWEYPVPFAAVTYDPENPPTDEEIKEFLGFIFKKDLRDFSVCKK